MVVDVAAVGCVLRLAKSFLRVLAMKVGRQKDDRKVRFREQEEERSSTVVATVEGFCV